MNATWSSENVNLPIYLSIDTQARTSWRAHDVWQSFFLRTIWSTFVVANYSFTVRASSNTFVVHVYPCFGQSCTLLEWSFIFILPTGIRGKTMLRLRTIATLPRPLRPPLVWTARASWFRRNPCPWVNFRYSCPSGQNFVGLQLRLMRSSAQHAWAATASIYRWT